MIPVTQTKVVVKNSLGNMVVRGNCFAAVVASMLELPITEVPNVEVFFDDENQYLWLDIAHKFLKHHGYILETDDRFKAFHKNVEELTNDDIEFQFRHGGEFYLVTGISPRGVMHITIWKNGDMVHDPHPTREGILTHEVFEVIRKA